MVSSAAALIVDRLAHAMAAKVGPTHRWSVALRCVLVPELLMPLWDAGVVESEVLARMAQPSLRSPPLPPGGDKRREAWGRVLVASHNQMWTVWGPLARSVSYTTLEDQLILSQIMALQNGTATDRSLKPIHDRLRTEHGLVALASDNVAVVDSETGTLNPRRRPRDEAATGHAPAPRTVRARRTVEWGPVVQRRGHHRGFGAPWLVGSPPHA